jgi:ADP-L-glycero-D-manno-heptose 6-epimerase
VNWHYASSASVYGTLEHFQEDGPFQPQSPYAYSKYLFDRHVMKNPAKHITTTGFRYFNVYGHKGEEHKNDMASPYTKFIKQAEENGAITLFENSDQFKRDFISVEDVVTVHCRLIHNTVSGVYNIGTGRPVSFQDVGEAIARKYQASITYIPMPETLRRQYQAFTCADLSKLDRLIDMNWTDIRDYIETHLP